MLWPVNRICNKLFCGWQYHIFHNLIAFITTVYSSVYLSINCLFWIYFISPNKYINKCCIHVVYLYIYLCQECNKFRKENWCKDQEKNIQEVMYTYIYIKRVTLSSVLIHMTSQHIQGVRMCISIYDLAWDNTNMHTCFSTKHVVCVHDFLHFHPGHSVDVFVIFYLFTKLWKATISFVMCVCHSFNPSICLSGLMEQLGFHWTDFLEIWYLGIFQKSLKDDLSIIKIW